MLTQAIVSLGQPAEKLVLIGAAKLYIFPNKSSRDEGKLQENLREHVGQSDFLMAGSLHAVCWHRRLGLLLSWPPPLSSPPTMGAAEAGCKLQLYREKLAVFFFVFFPQLCTKSLVPQFKYQSVHSLEEESDLFQITLHVISWDVSRCLEGGKMSF